MPGQPGGGGKTGGSAPNSFEDGLSSLYTDASRLALAPDAAPHMQFIQLMQKGILQYRQVVQQSKAAAAAHTQSLVAGQASGMGGMGQPGGAPGGGMGGPPPGSPPDASGGGPPDMGGAGPGGPGAGPPPNQIAPGGGSGMSGYGGVVNPDDLQRVLAGAGGGGGGGG